MPLTEKEQQLFECMKKVDPTTLWGTAINNVVKDPEDWKVRRLIADLKSQAKDNPPIMVNILGRLCYETLITL